MSDDTTGDFFNSDGSINGMIRRDPWATEVEAARAVLPHLSALRALIYQAFMDRPSGLTDMELEVLPQFRGLAETTASKRRTELFQAGALRPIGKRKNANGRTAIVWAISPREFRATPRAPVEACPHCGRPMSRR